MKNLLVNIYRCIVGGEYGFIGEGNEQWYYFLSLVMNLMLLWWLKPEIALMFTVLSVIHYVTVFVYGYFMLDSENVIFSYIYFGIHIILLILAIVTSFKWTVITAVITVVSILLAPDCTGNNIFLRVPNVTNSLPLIFNTIIFVAFVVLDFMLPIELWIKILIIVGALIIHPVIDWFEGECVIISDVTSDAFGNIMESWKL